MAEVGIVRGYGHLIPLEAPAPTGEKSSTRLAGSNVLTLWRWKSGACGDEFSQTGQEMEEGGREGS